jgi:hypothetical protein
MIVANRSVPVFSGEPTSLAIGEVEVLADLSVRVSDDQVVERYADLLTDGHNLPPICVVRLPDGRLVVVDGCHRLLARRRASFGTIDALVMDATWPEASFFAVALNGSHGLSLTVAQKRRAVERVLRDATWASLSDRAIARAVGVSHPFVARVRHEVASLGEAASVGASSKASLATSAQSRGTGGPGADRPVANACFTGVAPSTPPTSAADQPDEISTDLDGLGDTPLDRLGAPDRGDSGDDGDSDDEGDCCLDEDLDLLSLPRPPGWEVVTYSGIVRLRVELPRADWQRLCAVQASEDVAEQLGRCLDEQILALR